MIRLVIILIVLVVAVTYLIKFGYSMYRQIARENSDDALYLRDERNQLKTAKGEFDDAYDKLVAERKKHKD